MSASLLYESLDVDTYEIRLLCLCPGERGSIIQCELKRVDLMRVNDFAALSYCWGDATLTRDIMVNNIAVPVTCNLEDALQRLRELNITRLWVDAVCINQCDKMERSSQVRIMKQIYSGAAVTYAWLGPGGDDNTITAMCTLRRVYQIPHTRSYEGEDKIQKLLDEPEFSAVPQRRTCGYLKTTMGPLCEMCLTEHDLRRLSDFLTREYWRRRWIIQEMAVTNEVLILCEGEILTLPELKGSFERCRLSPYWSPIEDVASRNLQRVLEIRDGYQYGDKLDICQAIAHTQDSCSKDPRDKIFALIGICSDGPELVPLPSYSQAPDDVVRDFSREVLRKRRCFDIILMDTGPKSRLSQLPSWAPDWLSSGLPENAGQLAHNLSLLDHGYTIRSLKGDPDILKLHGVSIGTITAVTFMVGNNVSTITDLACPTSLSRSNTYESRHYYCGGVSKVACAFIDCLMSPSQISGTPGKSLTRSVWLYRISRAAVFGTAKRGLQDEQDESYSMCIAILSTWLEANSGFTIDAQGISCFLTFSLHHARRREIMYVIAMSLAVHTLDSFIIAICFGHKQTPPPKIGEVPGIFLTIAFFQVCAFAWIGIFVYFSKEDIINNVTEALRRKTKIAITDRGMLARVSPYAEVGDQVCFLAGCSRAAVLRREGATGRRYRVIGQAVASLSKADESKFKAFTRKVLRPKLRQLDLIRHRRLINEYQKEDWWREFVLI